MTRTILIVDDAFASSDALELALTGIPQAAISVVATAEEALRRLTAGGISALITDLNLPAMDGFELIERVRSQNACAGLPILVISGDSDPRTPARLVGLGADAYFPKPYSPAEVRSKLERLLDAQ